MQIAKGARRKPHPLYKDTDDPRCFYSHQERFDYEPEYAKQMQDNGHCGRDGILWFIGTDNDTGETRVWLDADKEAQNNIDRAAGTIPVAKYKPARKDSRGTKWPNYGTYSSKWK